MDAKLTAYLDDMRRRGVPFGTYAPPLWRAVWWLGVPMPPIFFWPAWGIAFILGGTFAGGIFVVSFLVEPAYDPVHLSTWQLAILDLGGGLVFGTILAAVVKLRARRLGLPHQWQQYMPGL
jgi:hypothetical protein